MTGQQQKATVGDVKTGFKDKFRARLKLMAGPIAARLNSKRAKLLAILVTVVVVGASAYGVYKILHKPAKPQETAAERYKAAYEDSLHKINTQQFDSATQSLNQMLKNSSQDDNQKYETLVALGGTYFANQQPDKALETLLAAENIKHDQTASTIFVTIAQLYIQKGDNTMGAAYYRKAIMRAKATPESADDGYIPEYESAIKSLGETP